MTGDTGDDENVLVVELAEFLESHPPGSQSFVRGDVRTRQGRDYLEMPELQLHCPSDRCGGVRIFHSSSSVLLNDLYEKAFLSYMCRNCSGTPKIIAVMVGLQEDRVHIYKIGEIPAFGPPVPSRVISMIGPDRDLFLKGRRAENQGLGVGAFAYYRRVVEGQWQRIVDEIIRVADTVGAPQDTIDTLHRARAETQFKRAVDMIRDAVPESLRVNGHNPITLLYAALSEGLHDGSDGDCLDLAGSVRVVLTELAERLGQALKDEREVQEAISRLTNRR